MRILFILIVVVLGPFSNILNAADNQRDVTHPCPLSDVTIESYLELKNAAPSDKYAPIRKINCYLKLLSDGKSDQAILVSLMSLGMPKGVYSAQEYSKFVEYLCVNKTKFLLDAMNLLDDASLNSVVSLLQNPLVTNSADIDYAMNTFRSEPSYATIVLRYFETEK